MGFSSTGPKSRYIQSTFSPSIGGSASSISFQEFLKSVAVAEDAGREVKSGLSHQTLACLWTSVNTFGIEALALDVAP